MARRSLRTDCAGWEEAENWEDLAQQNGDAGETLSIFSNLHQMARTD